MKNRFYSIFKETKSNIKFADAIGCSLMELELHLINKFENGMTMDNYGLWEVDHIIPISNFNFIDVNNISLCFNYKNLQPLWKEENRKKSNKLIDANNVS